MSVAVSHQLGGTPTGEHEQQLIVPSVQHAGRFGLHARISGVLPSIRSPEVGIVLAVLDSECDVGWDLERPGSLRQFWPDGG